MVIKTFVRIKVRKYWKLRLPHIRTPGRCGLLHEIIEKYGLERFNQIESEVNASIEAEDTVIATGGSVVYGTEAMIGSSAYGGQYDGQYDERR